MAEFIVHGIPGSPYVRVALLALEEKGADYELRRWTPAEMRTDAHLALHPFARIPVLDHQGFVLYESQVIVRYLEQIRPEPSLTPESAQATARMNQIMGIADWYVCPSISAAIVFNRLIAPRLGRPGDETAVQAALPKARICADVLEGLLGTNDYLVGARVSMADLQLAPHLDYFTAVPEGAAILQGTRLLRWIERMRERRSMQATRLEALAVAA